MKTKEELFDQVQNEFDKERKKTTWNIFGACIYSPIISFAIILFCYFLVICISKNSVAIVYILAIILLLACAVIIWIMYIIEPIQTFKITSIIKTTEQEIENVSENQKELKEKITSTSLFMTTDNRMWYPIEKLDVLLKLAREYRTDDFKELTESVEKKLNEFDEKIALAKIKLEFYNQVPERNFWQYLKSMMWLKKVKKPKIKKS